MWITDEIKAALAAGDYPTETYERREARYVRQVLAHYGAGLQNGADPVIMAVLAYLRECSLSDEAEPRPGWRYRTVAQTYATCEGCPHYKEVWHRAGILTIREGQCHAGGLPRIFSGGPSAPEWCPVGQAGEASDAA